MLSSPGNTDSVSTPSACAVQQGPLHTHILGDLPNVSHHPQQRYSSVESGQVFY